MVSIHLNKFIGIPTVIYHKEYLFFFSYNWYLCIFTEKVAKKVGVGCFNDFAPEVIKRKHHLLNLKFSKIGDYLFAPMSTAPETLLPVVSNCANKKFNAYVSTPRIACKIISFSSDR